MYKVVFTQRALKDLKRLDKSTKKVVIDRLAECAKEPLKYAHKLVSSKIGT